jgi:hypothetical protein
MSVYISLFAYFCGVVLLLFIAQCIFAAIFMGMYVRFVDVYQEGGGGMLGILHYEVNVSKDH